MFIMNVCINNLWLILLLLLLFDSLFVSKNLHIFEINLFSRVYLICAWNIIDISSWTKYQSSSIVKLNAQSNLEVNQQMSFLINWNHLSFSSHFCLGQVVIDAFVELFINLKQILIYSLICYHVLVSIFVSLKYSHRVHQHHQLKYS